MIARLSQQVENLLARSGLIKPSFYTSQEHALAELQRRQEMVKDDKELLSIIKPIPEMQRLFERPHLIFFRQVATPNYETINFLKLANKLEIEPCIIEYTEDKFVSTHNEYKRGLGKLPLFQFTDRNKDDAVRYTTVLDFNSSVGKHIAEVRTTTGQSLRELHHDLFDVVTGVKASDIAIDASSWFSIFNSAAKDYYYPFLSLFVKHNILAEIFLELDPHERRFTETVVRPAYKAVTSTFGVKPLVLNYLPSHEQTRRFWNCYPNSAGDYLRHKGYNVR